MKSCDQNLLKTFKIVDELIALANQGDLDREDVGCGVLYGIMRDAAYRIQNIAEAEKEKHVAKGWWS